MRDYSQKWSYHIGVFALGHTASLQRIPLSLSFFLQPHHYIQDTSQYSHEHHAQKQSFSHSTACQTVICYWTVRNCSGQEHICWFVKVSRIISNQKWTCICVSLLGCPSVNTSTTTVAEVASPDSWSIAVTCKACWLFVTSLSSYLL